jgi:hypothetical protein
VTRKEIRLLLTAQHGPDLPVMLSCDTKYLGRETIRELLVGLERVLVEAACGESDVEQLGRLSGVRPAGRGPSWVRCGASRVDLAATQELWQQVAGPRAGAVLAQELPAPELVAFVTGDTAPSFTDLHRAFVDALQRRNDVQAPSSYRWVAAAPADPGDPAAWQAATVRAQSDGRG